MINSSELRIGNIIIANGLHGGKEMTVEQIGSKGTLRDENRVILFEGHDVGEFVKDCVGVSLSPEILERYGKRSKWHCGAFTWGISRFYKLRYDIAVFRADDGTLSIWKGGNTALCRVEYLHQLQNIYFALTNTELTPRG